MSGSDYNRTPNYALYKPVPTADIDQWGDHLNFNADTLDTVIKGIEGKAGVTSWNTRTGVVTLTNADVVTVLPASGSAPLMDGTAAAGSGTTWSRADHVHPTDTTRYAASNPAGYQTMADVTTALGPYALTANVPAGSAALPVMDGTAAAGAATAWSRGDHIHPTDTSRYAATNPSGYQTAAQVQAAVAPTLNGVGRNRAHNSRFNINQRTYVSGTALVAGAYGHDRWKAGAGGCTYTFTATPPATTITITAGTLQQIIEGLNVEGGNYVLSWTGTAQGRVGAGTYAASPVTVAGITAGANTTIEFNAGTLSGVQFEPGTVATPLEKPDPQQDLAKCQRFYTAAVPAFVAYTAAVAGALGTANVVFPVTMRAVPTVTVGTDLNAGINLATGAPDTPTTQGMRVLVTANAAGTTSLSRTYNLSADL